MASVYDLKPKFQNTLRPLLKWLVTKKITPNVITLIALIGSISVGLLPLFGFFKIKLLLLWPIWLFVRMALNALDGMIAREFNMSSYRGFILNEAGDVISDLALYFPLIFVAPEAFLPITLFCVGAMFTEFCGILPKAAGLDRYYQGPMGKSDRAFFVGILALVTAIFPHILMYWRLVFIVSFILTIITAANRIKKSFGQMKSIKGV